MKNCIRAFWLAACIVVVTPRLSAEITLVSRLSDARASAFPPGFVSNTPPPQTQTDFSPANLSNFAQLGVEQGFARGISTSNSTIVADQQAGTLQITGDGDAIADALSFVPAPATGSASAKLITISFTLLNGNYSYALGGQLSGQQFTTSTGSGISSAMATLTRAGVTIFEVVAEHPPAVTLSENGILQPGDYILTVELNAFAQSHNAMFHDGSGSIGSGNFNLTLDPVTTPTPPPPTPTPTAVEISGTLFYCSNPTPGSVSGVTLSLTGSMAGSTLSDGSGNYAFSSLTAGGTYTVTPAKPALLSGAAGISTVDLIAVQRHFLTIALLSGCRLTAADVNGDANVTTVDVIAIQRFYLGLSTGVANVGQYQFSPPNRTYNPLIANQSNQNYDALIFGDVAVPFVAP